MSTFLKKASVVGASSAMLLASIAPFAAATTTTAQHAVGTNVVSNGTVYFLNNSGQKQAYTSAGAFLSYGFNSWSNVVAASAQDLAMPSGPFVPPMDGSLINDNGTVYLMTNGQRAGFTSAANFTGLGYSFSNVINGDTSFLTTAANINTTAMSHPVGTLVLETGTVYLMTTAGKMGIPSLSVFNSWGYSFSKVVTANSYDNAIGMNSGIMQARQAGQLNPTGSTVVIPPSSGMSVGVASTNPASSTLVVGQGLANLAEFTFYGNGAVTSVNLKRIGVSADSSLSNVFLFDGASRLTDAASVSSGSMINFSNSNGLFTVSGSKTISVKADLAGSAGETIGIQLVSAMAGSASVSGTPVSGNLHTVASATLAGVSFTDSETASGNTNAGNDILVWQNDVSVSTRDVLMNRLSLRQIGSINTADIKNFDLFIDGVLTASQANLDANGYVTFNFSKALNTGTHVVRVLADVIGGSSRTVQMSLRGAYDVTLTDTQYNVGIKATAAQAAGFPITPSAFTVAAGTMTVVKATDSQSSALTLSASDQSFGKWNFTAYGESIKVETLKVGIDFTDGGVANAAATWRNGRVLVNGAQVGSTTTITEAGVTFTTNFTVNPGTPVVVEVRADVFDNDGTGVLDSSDTAKAQLLVGTSNGIPQTSLTPINVPTATVDGNTLSVATGTLSLAKDATYASRNVVVPATAYKVADFNLTNGNVEDINVNTFTLTFTSAGGGASFGYQDLTDVYIKYGANQTAAKATLTGTDSYSVSYTAAKNSVTAIEVYANISNAAITADDTLVVNLAVTATSASGQTANVSAVAGQTLTAKASGTITQVKAGNSPAAKIVSDNQTVDALIVDFTAVDDSYVITDVTVTVPAGGITVASQVILKDGATTLATKPGATTVTFNGLNIAVPTGTASKSLTVALQLGTVGVGAGDSGANIQVAMTTVTARSNASGASATVSGGTQTGNAMYVYASVPNINRLALPSSALSTGTVTLAKFSVVSDGGAIDFDELLFSVTKTGRVTTGPAVSAPTLWDADTNTQIAAAGSVATLAAADAAGSIAFDLTTPETVNGTKNYLVKATVAATLAAGDNINTTLGSSGLGYVAPTTAALVGATATFVWSDRSASSHAVGTSDWSNDYLVKFLPLDSWTLSFN